jgi:hypothetical protein
MKLLSTIVVASALTGAVIVATPAAAQTAVPFSDPSRIGTVRISSLNSKIVIRGENRRDVLIDARGEQDDSRNRVGQRGRTAGLRRLAQAPGFEAVEENNQIIISTRSGSDDDELVVSVPLRTNLKVSGTNGDGITVDGVEGDIEVQHTNGEITLTNVAGTVIAHTTNGDVKATLTRLTPDKPMAFTSFNGDVDVTLPTTRATFKLRSDMGDIYTDFDLKVTTQTSASPGTRSGGRFRIEVNKALTGTLNGGGPEIELRTYNGDVYLRRGGQ